MSGLPGAICLQGGRELTPPCREMDAEILVHGGTRVAVLAGAARPGDDYAGASERARAHYEELGAAVRIVPDPRHDPSTALDALDDAVELLVLPGGSPGGLLEAIAGAVADRIRDRHRAGMAISGASAGAMVLCSRTVVPASRSTAAGLGLVPGIAIPHWSPGTEDRWPLEGSADTPLWGLPECGGVLVDGDGVRAVGRGEPAVRVGGSWSVLPRERSRPVPTGGG